MDKITIEINTTNAAFDEGVEYEVARILKEIAAVLEGGLHPKKAVDMNGNIVGKVTYKY